MSQEPSTPNPKAPEDWRVGLFFHSFYPMDHPVPEKRGKRGNQGYVIRRLGTGPYEVMLFSWLSGDVLGREIKELPYFDGASWYSTEEEWVREGARGCGNNVEESVTFWRNMKEMDKRWAREESKTERPKREQRRKEAKNAIRRYRFDIFMRDGFKCRYCGRSPPAVELHVDHIVPLANGGTDELSNLCAACAECNLSKRAKTVKEPTP